MPIRVRLSLVNRQWSANCLPNLRCHFECPFHKNISNLANVNLVADYYILLSSIYLQCRDMIPWLIWCNVMINILAIFHPLYCYYLWWAYFTLKLLLVISYNLTCLSKRKILTYLSKREDTVRGWESLEDTKSKITSWVI